MKSFKLNKKTKQIILYTSVGLIAVYVIARLIKKSDTQNNTGGIDPCAGRNKNTTTYGQKVMKLQENVGITGCDIDGIVGNQTNGAVKAAYPNLYARYGKVTTSNIDIYLDGEVMEAREILPADQTYANKVKELQKRLGLPANQQTGIATETTNSTLQRKYPTYYRNYGKVALSNIDSYLQVVRSQVVFGQ